MILRVRAPFAAYRPFLAGSFRATACVMPPSAAYGLVLNLASIDARDASSPGATRLRKDAPSLRVAVGVVSPGAVASLYQQLHAYPVGESGKELADRTHGAKFWIAPVRREIVVDFDGAVAFESAGGEVEERVASALAGSPREPRYGLPFAGDNNLMFDRIELCSNIDARWAERVAPEAANVRNSIRLPCRIDRDDQSRTEIGLFAVSDDATGTPPAAAWVVVGP